MTTSSRRVRSLAALFVVITIAASTRPALRADIPSVASGSWMTVGEVGAIPAGAASAALPDGRLLVAGGTHDGALSALVAIYDPSSGQWTPGGNLLVARTGHAVALLKDGRVLISGGTTVSGPTFDVEVFDLATATSNHAGDDARNRQLRCALQRCFAGAGKAEA
jgi:hypothetical protein